MIRNNLCCLFILLMMGHLAGAQGDRPVKNRSTFYHDRTLATARANIERDPLFRDFARQAEERAKPWREMTDEQLWGLMFGATIPRSWMVWSDGHCPACTQPVPMYQWRMDALNRPWKVTCPQCKEQFPKNDFAAFYRSGLDARGVFDPAKADRALLFNTEHPDPGDPLHRFGVDDGAGYSDGAHRWRFIGAYLIYGQWKQAVLGGINHLANAYLATGDPVYARKAGILLDRVADLYPTFDFKEQAVVYEKKLGSNGYVSVWHDACEETREMALAYDMVFNGLAQDQELVAFLAGRAKAYALPNGKATFADVQRNIEDGLLRHPLAHAERIHSNYPRTEIARAILEAVQGWPEQRPAVLERIDAMVRDATRVDGVTGEKGLGNYSSYVIQALAQFLQQMSLAEPDFLASLIERQPALRRTWRFHIDTLCLGGYYPTCGDAGWFAYRQGNYAGVTLPSPLTNSMYTFLWELYRATGDPAYVQALYQGNDRGVEELPKDLFCADPAAVQRGVAEVIAQHGAEFELGSINLPQWRLAILRAGAGPAARAAWLDYDWGGGHSHSDGMNLGLYAYGLDLLPDFGYPPVNHGGWDSPRAQWYTRAAAHNTVVVDGADIPWSPQPVGGATTLWADGQAIRAVRASAPGVYAGCTQYERTVFMIDLSPEQCYLLDIFRVAGGQQHVKSTGSHFGAVTTQGLALVAGPAAPAGVLIRHITEDPAPGTAWSVDWQIDDRYRLREPGAEVHLRYTDLTEGAAAQLGEAWVQVGQYDSNEEAWVPRVMVRRSGPAGLRSTFVAVLEPYEKTRALAEIARLPLDAPAGDGHVAAQITAADGSRALLVALNAEDGGGEAAQRDWGLALRGETCYLQRDAHGRLVRAALFHGTGLTVDGLTLSTPRPVEFVEVALIDGVWTVVAGETEGVVL